MTNFNLDKNIEKNQTKNEAKSIGKLTTLPAHQSLDISKEIH